MHPSRIRKQKLETGEELFRKVFYYDNDQTKPILAAGVLLVKDSPNKEVLVQKVSSANTGYNFTDFGGKIDLEDKSVIEAIARELGEEINFGIFENGRKMSKTSLKKFLQTNIIKKTYIQLAKYFLIFVKFDPSQYSLDMDIIGNKETHDEIPRTVEWITAEEFVNSHFAHHLHPRLWSKDILQFFGHRDSLPPPKRFGFKSL